MLRFYVENKTATRENQEPINLAFLTLFLSKLEERRGRRMLRVQDGIFEDCIRDVFESCALMSKIAVKG